MAKLNAKARKMLATMKDVARVATAMVDGEEAQAMITERAAHHVANPDPKYRSMAGDYYDVDHATFLRIKKTLIRLERVAGFPCNARLWLTLDVLEDQVTTACQVGPISRWPKFGRATIPLDGELAECLGSGQTVVLDPEDDTELLTVLAPVFDSLGDAVGVVELTTQHPAAKRIAPIWN